MEPVEGAWIVRSVVAHQGLRRPRRRPRRVGRGRQPGHRRGVRRVRDRRQRRHRRGHRARHARLLDPAVARLRRGRHQPRRRRRRGRARAPPTCCTSRPARSDLPGAMFTASHNPAQYNGIKLCRAGAAPIGQDSGLVTIREWAERDSYDREPEPGRLGQPRGTSSPSTPPTCTRSSTSRAIRPLKVVVDAGNGMGGHTVPVVLVRAAAGDRAALLRARRHASPTTRPTRSTRRTWSTCRRPSGSTAPTSAWPSTATPTACSSSTRTATRSARRR